MSNNLEISIIVPVYNTEKYLRKCIDSILAQSFNDFELILVDDGSTDWSGAICDEYAKKDSRILVVHKENGGLSEARNAGLDIAKGKYIGFVDSDDWIHKDMYKTLIEAAMKFDAEISECIKVSIEKELYEDENPYNSDLELMSGIQATKNMLNGNKKNSVSVCNKLFLKKLLNGLQFKKGVVHEDNFFTYKAFFLSERVVKAHGIFYYHRVNPNSITRSKFNITRLAAIDAYMEMAEFYSTHQLPELQDLSLFRLLDIIRWYHFCVQRHIKDKKIKQTNKCWMRKIFKQNYLAAIKSKHISYKSKIAFTIFLLVPWLYNLYYLIKTKRGINRNNVKKVNC